MSDKLKPCPFCGGNDLSVGLNGTIEGNVYAKYIFCNDCHCHGRNNFPIGWCESEIEAVEAWNTRHEPKIKEQLEEVFKRR